MATKQLVIVDDSAELRESVALYAKAEGWRVLTSNGDNVPELQDNQPTLVLLDYLLGGAGPERWLEEFWKKYPNPGARVYFLTGREVTNELRAFERKQSLAGILRKPLDLERLNFLLSEGALVREENRLTLSEKELLFRAAEGSPFALCLLDATSLQVLYENPTAQANPLDETSHRGIQMLAHQIEVDNETSARNVEWDAHKEQWRRRQMCRTGQWYWMTMDWMEKEKRPALLMSGTWREHIENLGAILEHEFKITRLRFYRVTRLHTLEATQPSFTLQPEWQHGGGLEPNEKAWLDSETRVEENSSLRAVFDDYSQPYLIRKVSDQNPDSYESFKSIRWGNATHRALIPIWKEGVPIGLLALDRRWDHLPTRFAQDFPPTTVIDEHDMQLMAGLLELAKPMFADYVEERNSNRFKDWNATLTEIIQEATQETEARAAITRTLQRIREQWDEHQQPARDIYLIRVHEDDLLEAWAGVGPIWEVRRGQLFQLEEPFRQALKDTTVIHNFLDWYKSRPESEQQRISALFKDSNALDGLGSWMGTPLKQGNRTFGLLVIGVKQSYYFTEPRVQALENTSARLLPMFLWGLAQVQREWLRRVFAHEYREPVNRLLQLVPHLPTDDKRNQARALLVYQSAIIKNLRLLGEEGAEQVSTLLAVEPTCLNTVLKQVAETLQVLYPDKNFTGLEQIPYLYIKVPEDALYQVLFNLLENACKFGLEGESVSLSAVVDADTLLLNIRNRSPVAISGHDQDRIFFPYQRAGNAPSAKGAGIGLAVVRRLCNALGMRCELSEPGTPENPEICFTLHMPLVQSMSVNKENISYG